jgi:hypothetical protein
MSLLYKYRGANPRAIEMVSRGALWAATAVSFNDPFDCKARVVGDVARAEARDRIVHVQQFIESLQEHRTLGRRSPYGFSQTAVRRLLRQFANNVGDEVATAAVFQRAMSALPIAWRAPLARDAVRLVESKLSEVGVISLSARRDSLLMWSHYGDGHRGFCLGFEQAALQALCTCRPVTYSDRFPEMMLDDVMVVTVIPLTPKPRRSAEPIRAIPNDDPDLLQIVFTKSKQWSYEEEWRILLPNGGVEIPYFAPLREVIFGLRCQEELRENLIQAVHASGGVGVRFLQAATVEGEFALAYEDVPSG